MGVHDVLNERFAMTEIAINDVLGASATHIGPNLENPTGDEYWQALRALTSGIQGDASSSRLTWVVGSDVVYGMKYWKAKARHQMMMLNEIVVILRGEDDEDEVRFLLQEILQAPGDGAVG